MRDEGRTGSWRSAKERSSSIVTSSERTLAFLGIAREAKGAEVDRCAPRSGV